MLFRTTVLFALASVALAVEPEPQMLRSVQTQTKEEPSGIPPLMISKKMVFDMDETSAEQNEEDLGIGKGTFGMKKGMKCDGGFDPKKGMKKHCEGGMEKEFSMSWTTSDLKSEVSQELMKQLEDFIPEPEMLIGVSDEEMEAQLFFDEDVESDAPLTKTMEFGGIMKAEWGCKVTYEKSVKGISKKVECGGKYDAGSGKKELSATGESVLGYFN